MNESDQFTWQLAVFLVGSLVVFGTVISIVVVQVFATWRARMSVAREEAYRQLATDTADIQKRTANELDRTARVLEDLRDRTAELERMLREVG